MDSTRDCKNNININRIFLIKWYWANNLKNAYKMQLNHWTVNKRLQCNKI